MDETRCWSGQVRPFIILVGESVGQRVWENWIHFLLSPHAQLLATFPNTIRDHPVGKDYCILSTSQIPRYEVQINVDPRNSSVTCCRPYGEKRCRQVRCIVQS